MVPVLPVGSPSVEWFYEFSAAWAEASKDVCIDTLSSPTRRCFFRWVVPELAGVQGRNRLIILLDSVNLLVHLNSSKFSMEPQKFWSTRGLERWLCYWTIAILEFHVKFRVCIYTMQPVGQDLPCGAPKRDVTVGLVSLHEYYRNVQVM